MIESSQSRQATVFDGGLRIGARPDRAGIHRVEGDQHGHQPARQRSHQERLDLDQRRAQILRKLGPDSPYYIKFGIDLRDYAIGVLMGQFVAGKLLGIVLAKTSIPLPSPRPDWGRSEIRSMVGLAVSGSVEPFLHSAILQENWQPGSGATIATFFTGRCYYAFAEEYLREHRAESRAARSLECPHTDAAVFELDVVRYLQVAADSNPERAIIDRAEVKQLLGLATHAQIPRIVFLRAQGYTGAEIAAYLNMTENAVHKALSKFRADVAARQRSPGEAHGER